MVGVAAAATFSGLCVVAGVRARSLLRALAPPALALLIERASRDSGDPSPPPALILAEIDGDRRGALTAMGLLVARFRALLRIALAAGTGSAMLVLATDLGRNLQQASLAACACFGLGGLAAVVLAQLGHAARGDCRRFRDQWNQRQREAARTLEPISAAAEWTDPGGAR
ncbi:MAG TPA: hypothetical protein VM686_25770 [Polyangiaceae bacterium]|nr:hypothetical protein [Polyangiaceae bacterium]